MKKMYVLSVLVLLVACACGGGKDQPAIETDNVRTSPETLSFTVEPQTQTLNVTADGPVQVYSNDSWVKVDPAYIASGSGVVSISVLENMDFEERTSEVVVKCGTVRHKVSLTRPRPNLLPLSPPKGINWYGAMSSAAEVNLLPRNGGTRPAATAGATMNSRPMWPGRRTTRGWPRFPAEP